MDRPRTLHTLHWCDAGTPTPACTSVVLLHGPGGLLSRGVGVHGALDPGSAFRVAVRGLAGAFDVGIPAGHVVWAGKTYDASAIHGMLLDLVRRVMSSWRDRRASSRRLTGPNHRQ